MRPPASALFICVCVFVVLLFCCFVDFQVHATFNTELSLEIVLKLVSILDFKRSEFRSADMSEQDFIQLQVRFRVMFVCMFV